MVESSSDEILADADKVDVAFLVVGDPFRYRYLEILVFSSAHTNTITPAQQLTQISSSAPAKSPSKLAPSLTLAF